MKVQLGDFESAEFMTELEADAGTDPALLQSIAVEQNKKDAEAWLRDKVLSTSGRSPAGPLALSLKES